MAGRRKLLKGATQFLNGAFDLSDDDQKRPSPKKSPARGKLIRGASVLELDGSDEEMQKQPSVGSKRLPRKKLLSGATGEFNDVNGVARGKNSNARRRYIKGGSQEFDSDEDVNQLGKHASGRRKYVKGGSQDFDSDEDAKQFRKDASGRRKYIKGGSQEFDSDDDANPSRKDSSGRRKYIKGGSQEFDSDDDAKQSRKDASGRRKYLKGGSQEFDSDDNGDERRRLLKGSTGMLDSDEDAEKKGSKSGRGRLVKGASQFMNGSSDEGATKGGRRLIKGATGFLDGLEDDDDDAKRTEGARRLRKGTIREINKETLARRAEGLKAPLPKEERVKEAAKLHGTKGAKKFKTAVRFAVAHAADEDDGGRTSDGGLIQSLRDQIDELTRENKRLRDAQSDTQERSAEAAPVVSQSMHNMHMSGLQSQLDALMQENRRLSKDAARVAELERMLAAKEQDIEQMRGAHERLEHFEKHIAERVTLKGASFEDRIDSLVNRYLDSQGKLEKQRQELDTLRSQSNMLTQMPQLQDELDKKRADLDAQIGLFQKVSDAFPRTATERDSLQSSEAFQSEASTNSTRGFSPIVSVYDCEDESGSVTRTIEIQAPGRHLEENGQASVDVDLQPLPNGFSVKLSREGNLPDAGQIVPPFAAFEAGTWEWRYEPKDGVWNISKYWGLEHGILAVSMTQIAPASAEVDGESSAIAGGPARKLVKKRRSTKRASLDVKCIQVLRDTTLISEEGFIVEASSLYAGQRVKGPKGFAEVVSVRRYPKQEHKLLTLCMGLESVSVLPDQTTYAFEATEDGAATFDYKELPFGELQVGTNELLSHTIGGVEQNVALTDVKRKKRQAVLLEIAFVSPGSGVFVVPSPNSKQSFVTIVGKQGEALVSSKNKHRILASQAPVYALRRGLGNAQWH